MCCDPVIEVADLTKCYHVYQRPGDRLKQMIVPRLRGVLGRSSRPYFKEFWALKGVSFRIGRGESVGILGRNGSGKSTLLQIIAGTLMPTSGRVDSTGRLTALLELGSGFNPEFSGRDNVYLNGVILGLSKEEIDRRFDEIADFADIGDHMDQPVKTYSSGMVVRLAFAVQACVDPRILIVDEALSVGDEKFQRKCFEHIERLRAGGCSILLVTHSTATVEKFCQRAILLDRGKVHAIGAAKEVVDSYHALLYADESASPHTESAAVVDRGEGALGRAVSQANGDAMRGGASLGPAAVIDRWEAFDESGRGCTAFRSGDWVTLRLFVEVLGDVPELQAGFLLRTVEGVSVFGTSTLYSNQNVADAAAGDRFRFEFKVQLNLTAGSYFVTFAVAEAISEADMRYLDRKADVMVLKVAQFRLTGSGLCVLPVSTTVSREKEVGA